MRFLLIFSLLALAACSEPTIPKDNSIDNSPTIPKKEFFRAFKNEALPSWFYIFEDPDTGCQYIIYSSISKAGITPRMEKDASGIVNQICRESL